MRYRYLFQLSRVAIALGLLGSLLLAPAPASAHERRDVGKYQFNVGFLNEPAIQGQPNGAYVAVTDREAQKPVEGLERSLKVAVAFGGGQAKEFPLRARFGMAGQYIADLIPTRSGAYVFTFTGTIDGQQVNERFESGPGRFNDVEAATALQFPVPEPSGAQLQQALSEAQQQASTARTLAIGGLVAGLLGLLLGGYALTRARRANEGLRVSEGA